MKKMLLLLLALACLLALIGCKGQVAEVPETKPSEDQKVEMAEPYFTGKVLEKYDGSCLMEVTEAGSGLLAVGQEVVVHINAPECPDFVVGDTLTVTFDGKMTCSLPPQVVGVAILVKHG